MQLKSLWIKDYKNLKDFSLDFEKGNHLSILIGNKDKKSTDIQNYLDYTSDDGLLKAVFYPYSNEVSSGEFLLEDYFSEKKLLKLFII